MNLSPYREQFTNLKMIAVIEFDTVTITIAFELTHRCVKIWKAAQHVGQRPCEADELGGRCGGAHKTPWSNRVSILSTESQSVSHLPQLIQKKAAQSPLNVISRKF
ncbi:hypothetical protein PGTUg99_035092 [Puccinia graminis f. sp. tritici]|uniref:Uncharacterized protein n=1 Tax=Puccinia graminis f. sp. tritici TaxID=56615 RepID=A0A5B0SJ07_PUCGR|nr:hypothetical protein PGTUg99_035092 [Puccinia graminis f. sp. tritici]